MCSGGIRDPGPADLTDRGVCLVIFTTSFVYGRTHAVNAAVCGSGGCLADGEVFSIASGNLSVDPDTYFVNKRAETLEHTCGHTVHEPPAQVSRLATAGSMPQFVCKHGF